FVANFFIFYWSLTSHITPPVAPAAFVAAGLAGASMWKTCWTSMRLGLILLILPFFFVYNPALLMQGSALSIVEATFTAIIGTIVLASALQGYLFDYTKLWQRIFMGIGGLLLIFPDWKTEVIGVAFVIPAVLIHWRSTRSNKAEKLAVAEFIPSKMAFSQKSPHPIRFAQGRL
ncbi:MAG: TRAP-type uncharacterized transport system, fused permease component, partial [Dehalococcoidia bacterium]|nr:TRAP-type uncharacterized transport system, fused permease component [Dehalococcoidia bacterium]